MIKLIDKSGNVFAEGHCLRDVLYDLSENPYVERDGLWYIDDYCGEALAYESKAAAEEAHIHNYEHPVSTYTITGEDELWYAVESDSEDNDWGTGSYDLKEAIAMAKKYGDEAQIAIINNGPDPICEGVITSGEFDNYLEED